jgi:Protein of unknown function (DUF4235)
MQVAAIESIATRDAERKVGVGAMRQAVKVAVLESAATYVVHRGLEFAYRRITGRELPTARDRDVPFRQVLAWACITAAAVAAADVIVDQFVLRRESPSRG